MLDKTFNITESRDTAIYRGAEFARSEIVIAITELETRIQLLKANLRTLNENFALQKPVEIKQVSENLSAVAGDTKKTASQIEALSASLAGVFLAHINRRSRV